MRAQEEGKIDSDERIKGVNINLEGFNMEELKDIIGYIRFVEAFRPTRLVWVKMEDPDMSLEEARRLLNELWPEEEGPLFMATLKMEETED